MQVFSVYFNFFFQVTVDVRSPVNGKLTKFYVVEGQEVSVDEDLFEIVEQDGVSLKPTSLKVEKKVADVVFSESKTEVEKKNVSIKAKQLYSFDDSGHRTETRVKMTRMRQRISQRLKDSQNTAAMLTTFQEVDMTNLIDLRNKYKEDFEKSHGVKLGFMSAFVRVMYLIIYMKNCCLFIYFIGMLICFD